MANQTIRTPEKRARLVKPLRLGKSIAAACRAAAISRAAYYDWYGDDADFAAAMDAAKDEGTDYLEDKARDRAIKESDTLLIFLLKGRRPETYRDTAKVTHDGEMIVRVVYDDDDHT